MMCTYIRSEFKGCLRTCFQLKAVRAGLGQHADDGEEARADEGGGTLRMRLRRRDLRPVGGAQKTCAGSSCGGNDVDLYQECI